MESFNEAWQLICDFCKTRITDVAYKTWISRIQPIKLDFDDGKATLMVPNEFHRQTLNRCYLPLLNNAFSDIFGSGIDICFTIPSEVNSVDKKKTQNLAIDSEYDFTFDTYIVGSSNKFAHAAALAVAANPAGAYNPLFIYGNSGLGKTHLLYAISNDIKKSKPNLTTLYIKGDDFTNELIDSIRKNTTIDFHQKYREADLLLVDDIQFIAGKDSTQEEFFHTFNSLYEAKKQIVLTSDRPPKEIQTLEDRLRTRFEWGLMVDIQAPDYETRVAIVKNKAVQRGFTIDDKSADYIAKNVTTNVRLLEGVVNMINAHRDLRKSDMSDEDITAIVRDSVSKNNESIPSPNDIINEVSRFFGFDEAIIRGPSRSRSVVNARNIAMYLIRNITGLSTIEIGKIFDRDHSTAMHSLDQVTEKLQSDPSYSQTIKDITLNINSRR